MPSRLTKIARLILGCSSLLAVSAGATADELRVGLGVGAAPQFAGSDEYRIIPFPSISYKTEKFEITTRGIGVQANLSQSKYVDFGPIIRLDTGRNDFNDVDDPLIARLAQIDAGLELGGFVGTSYPLAFSEDGRPTLLTAGISAVQSLGGHEGVLASASLGFVKPMGAVTLVGSVSSTYATDKYNQSFFGISAEDALATGLSEFDIDGGVRDVGAGLVISYNFNEKWRLTNIAQYTHLIGDTADSPIVTRGSQSQLFGGLNISYRFR